MKSKIIENANEFLEAAKRCSFNEIDIEKGKFLLLVPELVNTAFACELYMKAIASIQETKNIRGHELYKLYEILSIDARDDIYNLWRLSKGNDLIDCNYIKKMFRDNLESISNNFNQFRYEHEWGGATIGGRWSHLSRKQYHLIGNTNIYNGFLMEFALVLKKYAEKLID